MVNEYENLLRTIILEILKEEVSKYAVSGDRLAKWEEKKEIEVKKNKGLSRENRLIFYSDFYDLKTIILKNWELFLPIFMDKKRFEVFFDEIENYRNTAAHGRELTKSQLLLLEGILSDLKTLKTIYHNKNEIKDDYFIRINKVSDNLGNVLTREGSAWKTPVLRVGDSYEVIVEAHDPKGREIEYELYSLTSGFRIIQKENRFNFVIASGFIAPYKGISVYVRTPESTYKNQDNIGISITVLPE